MRPIWFIFYIGILASFGLAGCRGDAAKPDKGRAGEAAEQEAAAPKDWCASHGVPESACTKCNPELIPAFKAKGDWCSEHGVPESQCVACNPGLKSPAAPAGGLEPAGESAEAGHDPSGMCSEHRVLESECAVCMADLGARLDEMAAQPGDALWPKLRLASSESAVRAGVRAVRAGAPEAYATTSGVAEITADEERAARVTAPADGVVRKLAVLPGQKVRAGQLLAVLSCPEVGEARGAVERGRALVEQAQRELARQEEIFARRLSPERDLVSARAEDATARADLAAAEARLASLTGGFAPDAGDPSSLVLKSTVSGEVTSRLVRVGQAVEMGDLLLEVVDRERLWCELSMSDEAAAGVRAGQSVIFQSESLPGRTFMGSVEAIIPGMDPVSRTVRVRASIANEDEALRPGLFGRAHVSTGAAAAGARVPAAALVSYSGRPVVFVRLDADLYDVRPVRTGARDTEMVDLLSGVAPGEEVVTDGAFLLKTQVSKGSIGAGCCETVARLEK